MQISAPHDPRVGLFVTCLVDLFRPGIGHAAVRLIEEAGYRVEVPAAQTCCGRPAFAADDPDDMRDHARGVIETYETYDYVVAPSSSCAALIRSRYPAVFADDALWGPRAAALAGKVHELTGFLTDIAGAAPAGPGRAISVTCHDCQERPAGAAVRLLGAIPGVSVRQTRGAARCCGVVDGSAVRAIRAAGAGTLVGADLGCLMGIAGELRRDGSAIEVRHIAEVLAGLVDTPPIGAATARRKSDQPRSKTPVRQP